MPLTEPQPHDTHTYSETNTRKSYGWQCFLDATKNEPLHNIIYSASFVYFIWSVLWADDDDCRALFGFVCKLNSLRHTESESERAHFKRKFPANRLYYESVVREKKTQKGIVIKNFVVEKIVGKRSRKSKHSTVSKKNSHMKQCERFSSSTRSEWNVDTVWKR